MSKASLLFQQLLDAAFNPVLNGTFKQATLTISAKAGLPFAITFRISQTPDELYRCEYGAEYVGLQEARGTLETLRSHLLHEWAPVLDTLEHLAGELSGECADGTQWAVPAWADSDNPEFRGPSQPMVNLLEGAARELLKAPVDAGSSLSSRRLQVVRPGTSGISCDIVWLLLDEVSGEDGTKYLVRTNDLDLMVGTAPSFYATAASLEELFVPVMNFLTRHFLRATRITVWLERDDQEDNLRSLVGDSDAGPQLVERPIYDPPV